jgi:hypothetical protein
MRTLAILSFCLLLGCKDVDADAPRAQTSGGFAITTRKTAGGSPEDASTSAARDASTSPGFSVLPSECQNVTLVSPSGESAKTMRYVNAVDEPHDLDVTRAVGTYEPSCTEPAVRIALSDGKCPGGLGHELTFLLDAAALYDGGIQVGQNLLQAETSISPIRVRYLRPRGLASSGEYGTCGTATSGFLTFRDPRLGTDRLSHFEALFQMFLPPCDGSDNAAVQVNGSFDVAMSRSLAQVCKQLGAP